jgi:hypothetical protein
MPEISVPQELPTYSIFISSESDQTLRDLRDACVQVSWEAGHSPKALLSPIGRADVERCIQTCDLYVRITAGLDSRTMAECFWANDARKPIILLMVGATGKQEAAEKLLKNSAAGSSSKAVSAEPYPFAKEYLIALHHATRRLDTLNAMKGSPLQAGEVTLRNPFLRRFASAVSQYVTLDSRFYQNVALKQSSAEFFLDRYFGILRKAAIPRLFFESGSAAAYLSEAFAGRSDEEDFEKWGATIETNNFISYLEFNLGRFQRVSLYPTGRPERRYGGTFGDLRKLSEPTEGAHPIKGIHYDRMCEIRGHFAEEYSVGIIFGAASGIDLSRGTELLGPHVGSYENMLFKRALLESGVPVVIFIDEDKIPRRAVPGQCFLVCDDDFSWHYACRNTPLAIVCAFRSEERAKSVIPDLEYLGFNHLETARHGEAPWPIIVSNDLFWNRRQEWLTSALDQSNGKDSDRDRHVHAISERSLTPA